MPRSSALSSEPSAGIWSIGGGKLALIEAFDVGPAIVLVPAEHLLLTTADLPLLSRRQRLAALPFAIEDRIAQPLDQVHVALGREVAPGRFLAGIVSRATMAEWVGLLTDAGLRHAALVPDALALPVPAAGWSVDLAGDRALVRTSDGAGFALPAANLTAAWELAGAPAVRAYGEALPFTVPADVAELEVAPLAARLARPALDLAQGDYAPPRALGRPLLRRIAWVAGLGVLAHGAIAAADTLALNHIADRRAEETRALVERIAPGALADRDLRLAAADLLPSGDAAFLPLVARISTGLAPLAPAASLGSLSFDGGAATIFVEAADPATLARVGPALEAAGLTARPGATPGSFTVRTAR